MVIEGPKPDLGNADGTGGIVDFPLVWSFPKGGKQGTRGLKRAACRRLFLVSSGYDKVTVLEDAAPERWWAR